MKRYKNYQAKFAQFLVLFVVVCSISACNSKDKSKEEKNNKITVKTELVEERSVPFIIRGVGVLSSKSQIKLSFKIGGVISGVFFNEGQSVKKGQVLASLNPAEIQAQVNQAQLAVQKAERDFKRAENLFNDSVATLEQFQNAKTAFDYASSTLQIASFNRRYSSIVAPANGTLLKKLAEQGEVIGAGYPVFLFGSSENDWVVRVNIPDKDFVNVKFNDSVNIWFDAFPGKHFYGFVSETASAADPYTGTFEVEITVKNMPLETVSGLIAKVEIITQKQENFAIIPINSLVESNEKSGYVFVLKGDTAIKEKVNISRISQNVVFCFPNQVIMKGKTIVTEGAGYLKNNSLVEIAN
jgi:membrane fusion protein, multidrug efflux system